MNLDAGSSPRSPWTRGPAVRALLLGSALAWAYLPALRTLVERWSHDPRYSHGFLVPAFSAYLLWSRRGMLGEAPGGPTWWGAVLVGLGAGLRLAGAYYHVEWFDAVSLLPMLAGLAALAGGARMLRWAWPAVAFLFFMVPLPYRVEMALGYPLQRVATRTSTYALQTFGLPAIAEGNIITIDRSHIGVVDACNGLGMLFMFFAFAVAATFVVRRPAVDRALIVLSAVPIALLANITRITVTGLLHATVGGKTADVVYHDLAGWLMMPLALAVLWAELQLLSRLLLEVAPAGVLPIAAGLGPAPGPIPPGDRPARGRRVGP